MNAVPENRGRDVDSGIVRNAFIGAAFGLILVFGTGAPTPSISIWGCCEQHTRQI